MPKTIDYYFTLNSPWAYLGGPRLTEIAARHGATVNVKPVMIGEVFGQTGGLPLPKRGAERQAYRLVELARWRDFLGLPLNLHPAHFPAPDLRGSCLVLATAHAGGDALALANALGKAMWAKDENIAEEDTLAEALSECGLDLDLLGASKEATYEARYAELTEEAIGRGVFGSPSYLYDEELFWGQDRLEFLERALAG